MHVVLNISSLYLLDLDRKPWGRGRTAREITSREALGQDCVSGYPYCRLRRLGIQWEGDLGATLMLFSSSGALRVASQHTVTHLPVLE